MHAGFHGVIELCDLVALSPAFPTTRGFRIRSFHLHVNGVIAGLPKLPSLGITGDCLTAALNSTNTLEILVLKAVPAVVGRQWVFASWYGTTWLSDGDTISHNDFGGLQHAIR
jgi:hypothetical protein